MTDEAPQAAPGRDPHDPEKHRALMVQIIASMAHDVKETPIENFAKLTGDDTEYDRLRYTAVLALDAVVLAAAYLATGLRLKNRELAEETLQRGLEQLAHARILNHLPSCPGIVPAAHDEETAPAP